MSAENHEVAHGKPGVVCSTCAKAESDKLIEGIRSGAFDVGQTASLTDEQLMHIFLAAATTLSKTLPGDESDQNKVLFRTLAMVYLQAP